MGPMLGRKVVKGKQDFFIFLQASAGFWEFGLVTGDELIIGCQSRFAGERMREPPLVSWALGRAHSSDERSFSEAAPCHNGWHRRGTRAPVATRLEPGGNARPFPRENKRIGIADTHSSRTTSWFDFPARDFPKWAEPELFGLPGIGKSGGEPVLPALPGSSMAKQVPDEAQRARYTLRSSEN
jgi:hypothetical protein